MTPPLSRRALLRLELAQAKLQWENARQRAAYALLIQDPGLPDFQTVENLSKENFLRSLQRFTRAVLEDR